MLTARKPHARSIDREKLLDNQVNRRLIASPCPPFVQPVNKEHSARRPGRHVQESACT